MRMTRVAIINVLASPYIDMAHLKGLSRLRVVVHHALPNALAPIINVVALNVAYLIVGVVVVETVFAYPGLGQLLVDSVSKRAGRPGRLPDLRGDVHRPEPRRRRAVDRQQSEVAACPLIPDDVRVRQDPARRPGERGLRNGCGGLLRDRRRLRALARKVGELLQHAAPGAQALGDGHVLDEG